MKTILVLYHSRGVFPLRDTIRTHLYSFGNYSKHRVIYVNIAFGFPEKLIRKLKIDVVIFHTIFLGMRWGPEIFRKRTQECNYLKELSCIKIAMPQDEFLRTDILNDFCNEFGITHILTCAYEPDWPIIYDKVDPSKVVFKTVLTGYLDPRTITRIDKKKVRIGARNIDIGYRAWKAEYWLGEHGMHKVRVAEVFQEVAPKYGLSSDISMRQEDVLAGDDWFDFLLRCRTTIGVEGGASVLDKYGDIGAKVSRFLNDNPGASFEETREKCFPTEDHKIGLACISPRHLEACVTETCQILVEGTFNGILQPWKHYIPLKKDYSNAAEICEMLKDKQLLERISRDAYTDIVASGNYTYGKFINELEIEFIDKSPENSATTNWFSAKLAQAALTLRDKLLWKFIQLEVRFYFSSETTLRQKIVKAVYPGIRNLLLDKQYYGW